MISEVSLLGELWLSVSNFPNYSVSSFGRVYSHYKNRVMKLDRRAATGGYIYAGFVTGGKPKTKNKSVHRLVMETFCPSPNMYKLQVNHRDFNRQNNRLDNLEWVTSSENSMYSHAAGRFEQRNKIVSDAIRGERNCRAKLNETQIREIRKSSHLSTLDLSIKYSVSRELIRKIRTSECWKHIK